MTQAWSLNPSDVLEVVISLWHILRPELVSKNGTQGVWGCRGSVSFPIDLTLGGCVLGIWKLFNHQEEPENKASGRKAEPSGAAGTSS